MRTLDGLLVPGIDEMLYPVSRSGWRKQRLAATANQSFQGSIVLGMGFTMSPEEARALIEQEPRNSDVLFPYLGGEDLNQSPTQTAPRWIINFFDWPEEQARTYPDCFAVVEEKIKPERQERRANGEFKRREAAEATLLAILAEKRPEMYRTIEPLTRVLAISQSRQARAARVRAHRPSAVRIKTAVFAYEDDFHFGRA